MRISSVNLDHSDNDALFESILTVLTKAGTNINDELSYTKPLWEICEYLLTLHPKIAFVQEHVQDPDYLAEHSAYYSQFTRKIKRYCTRVHFFSETPDSEDVLEQIDELHEKTRESSRDIYLGFVTLRPISICPIAATILLKPRYQNHRKYVISSDVFQVNLTGRDFYVNGTPYLQQDNAVGACAQAAIWMSLRTIKQREGLSSYNPAQITDAATKYILHQRILPNKDGLSLQQMNEAIRSTGYVPHTLYFGEILQDTDREIARIERMKSTIHSYIESGIPVILILKGSTESHAVTAIGHGWTETPERKMELGQVSVGKKNVSVYCASSWIEPIVIHNDNTGPYIDLPDSDENPDHAYVLSQAYIAIPILRDKDFIDSEAAKRQSIDLLKHFAAVLEVDENDEMPDLVFRTYMRRRSDFRKDVIDSNMSSDLKKYYREKWLPDRVWVTEINSANNYNSSPSGECDRLGLIILDVSSEALEYASSFLTVHLSGALINQNNLGVIIDQDIKKGVVTAEPVTMEQDNPLNRL